MQISEIFLVSRMKNTGGDSQLSHLLIWLNIRKQNLAVLWIPHHVILSNELNQTVSISWNIFLAVPSIDDCRSEVLKLFPYVRVNFQIALRILHKYRSGPDGP